MVNAIFRDRAKFGVASNASSEGPDMPYEIESSQHFHELPAGLRVPHEIAARDSAMFEKRYIAGQQRPIIFS